MIDLQLLKKIGINNGLSYCSVYDYTASGHRDYAMSVFDRLKPGRPRIEEYEDILSMRREGYTYDAISILLNIPRTTIASICQINNLGGKVNKQYTVKENQSGVF